MSEEAMDNLFSEQLDRALEVEFALDTHHDALRRNLLQTGSQGSTLSPASFPDPGEAVHPQQAFCVSSLSPLSTTRPSGIIQSDGGICSCRSQFLYTSVLKAV